MPDVNDFFPQPSPSVRLPEPPVLSGGHEDLVAAAARNQRENPDHNPADIRATRSQDISSAHRARKQDRARVTGDFPIAHSSLSALTPQSGQFIRRAA